MAGRHDELLHEAALSPDGQTVVALASPCVPSYFNDHLAVRRLAGGATWTVGASVPRCHLLSRPQWTSDSAQVLLTYAAPAGETPYTGADGSCSSFGDSTLVVLDITHPQPGVSGQSLAPHPGCSCQASAPSQSDLYAVQACGRDTPCLDGPATLVQLSSSLHVQGQWAIGPCTDGNSLAADPKHGVLISAHLYCSTLPRNHSQAQPTTALDHLTGDHLEHITTVDGGNLAYSDVSW